MPVCRERQTSPNALRHPRPRLSRAPAACEKDSRRAQPTTKKVAARVGGSSAECYSRCRACRERKAPLARLRCPRAMPRAEEAAWKAQARDSDACAHAGYARGVAARVPPATSAKEVIDVMLRKRRKLDVAAQSRGQRGAGDSARQALREMDCDIWRRSPECGGVCAFAYGRHEIMESEIVIGGMVRAISNRFFFRVINQRRLSAA